MRVLLGWPRASVVISCRATLTLNESMGDAAGSVELLPTRMRALGCLFPDPLDSVRLER